MEVKKDFLNKLGEFKDSGLEEEFANCFFEKRKKLIKYFILFLGIVFFISAVYDLTINYKIDSLINVFALKLFILMFSVFSFFVIDRLKNHLHMMSIISIYYLTYFFSNILLMVYFNKESVLNQVMTIVILTQITFLLPNRLIYQIKINILALGLFYITIPFQNISIFINLPMELVLFFLIFLISNIALVYKYNIEIRTAYLFKKEMQRSSELDHLTKIYHRMKIEKDLKYWCGLANRGETTFSVIIYDIDTLKNINKERGNGAGDHVLKQVAEILSCSIRKQDLYGRWGEDEFIIILPNASLESATAFAQRIRKKVATHNFKNIGNVTISVGVATYRYNEGSASITNRVNKLIKLGKTKGNNVVVTELEDI